MLFPISLNGQESMIFEDHFDRNNNKWAVDMDSVYLKVEKGKYTFENKKTGGHSSWNIIPDFDTRKDFFVSCNSEWVAGINNNGYGLILRTDNDNRLDFEISGDGHYRIGEYLKGNWVEIIPWTKSQYINKQGVNNIKIQKKDRVMEYYINGNKVNESYFSYPAGSKVGFTVRKRQKILFDDVMVGYIIDKNFTSDATVAKVYGTLNKETLVLEDKFNNHLNYWTEKDESGDSRKIEFGYYLIDSRQAGKSLSFKQIPLNYQRDFCISFNSEKVGGVNNSAYGLLWGTLDNKNFFDFCITGDGSYCVGRRISDNYQVIIPWTKSTQLKSVGTNNLKLVKTGGFLEFYINNNRVEKIKFLQSGGQGIGFFVDNFQKIRFDDLIITYIDGTEINPGNMTRESGRIYELPFADNFENNSNYWNERNDSIRSSIDSSRFLVDIGTKNKSGNFFAAKEVKLESQKDFTISCDTKWIGGSENNTYYLVWGANDEKNNNGFGITASGQFIYYRNISGYGIRLLPFTKSQFIKTKGSNNLKVVKIGDDLRFYINGIKVGEYPSYGFLGNKVGLLVYGNQKISFDNLKVSYLTPEDYRNEELLADKNKSSESGKQANNSSIISNSESKVVSSVDQNMDKSSSAKQTVQNTISINEKRIALVIGNSNYKSNILANPENDARAMKTALQNVGFTVFEYENLDYSSLKRAIDTFGEKLKGNDVGLFYYAGHGIQSKGYNYLVPVDAQLQTEQEVEYDCVQADRILAKMEGSGNKVNIIILDACRNNPFERAWTRSATGRGLAFMNAPGGTLIAYATSPGSTASDGSGNNGLYTSAILESINMADISILEMFQNVRSIVTLRSKKEQVPWESTSLTGNFYFNPKGAFSSVSTNSVDRSDISKNRSVNNETSIPVPEKCPDGFLMVKKGTLLLNKPNEKDAVTLEQVTSKTCAKVINYNTENTNYWQIEYNGKTGYVLKTCFY
jgi:hypothetical protein